jgi:uncharacterized membrane protein
MIFESLTPLWVSSLLDARRQSIENPSWLQRRDRTFERQCKEQSRNGMKDSPGLHLKTYVLIFFIVLFAPLGNVLLSKGMKGVGSAKNWAPGDIFHILASIITSGYIWLGIACLLTFFVAYMLVLTWADYSYVQPASSFSYAVVAMLGYFLLGEAVPPLRWIGIFVICVGVFIVGHTHPRTTEKA